MTLQVYFAQIAIQNGPVKIGISVNPYSRIPLIQGGLPFDLKIIRLIDGASEIHERELHYYFRNKHIRGEWFEFDPKMMSITYEECAAPESELVFFDLHRHTRRRRVYARITAESAPISSSKLQPTTRSDKYGLRSMGVGDMKILPADCINLVSAVHRHGKRHHKRFSCKLVECGIRVKRVA